MSTSANLNLPFVAAGQAQKHVTVNEGLAAIDSLMHLTVPSLPTSTPPVDPVQGSRWLIAPDATDDWAGHDGKLAVYLDGDWRFHAPQTGWLAHVASTGRLLVRAEDDWREVAPAAEIQEVERLGIGTSADASNPLAAKLNNVLFTALTTGEGGDGDLRFKMNKETAGDTASLLFQTGFSGRAEIGLVGDDDLAFKVSPNGASWFTGLVLDKDDGVVRMPSNPKFRASLDHDPYVVATAYVVAPFNIADHDAGGDFDDATGAFTCPVDGFYLFGAQLGFLSDGTPPTAAYAAFHVDGVLAAESEMRSTTLSSGKGFAVLTLAGWLTAGTVIDVRVYFVGGADSNLQGDRCQFWGCMVP